MIRLKHYHCGCELRTGTIVFLIIKATFAIYQLHLIYKELKKKDMDVTKIETVRYYNMLYSLTSGVAMIVACCTGIRVISKDRAKFLVPFICCQFATLFFYVIFFLWFWFNQSLYIGEFLEEMAKFVLDDYAQLTINKFLAREPFMYIVVMFLLLDLNSMVDYDADGVTYAYRNQFVDEYFFCRIYSSARLPSDNSPIRVLNFFIYEMCFKNAAVSCTFRATTIVYLLISVLSSMVCGSLYFTKHVIENANFTSEYYNDSVLFCYFAIDVSTAITGLYGIFEKKPRALLPFFIFKIFDLMWMTILALYDSSHLTFLPLTLVKLIGNAALVGNTNFMVHDEAAILILGCLLFVLGMKIYFTVILYKYYHVLFGIVARQGKVFARVNPDELCYISMT